MKRTTMRTLAAAVLAKASFAVTVAVAAPITTQGQSSLVYTRAQAAAGETVYKEHCLQCHGGNLDDGKFAPPLRGGAFLSRWAGSPAFLAFEHMRARMPPAAPDSLTEAQYVDVFAYILKNNIVPPAQKPLTADAAALTLMIMPSSEIYDGSGGIAPGVPLPPNPEPVSNPLATVRPVTAAMLKSPPDSEWLSWRRTHDAQGFSPLSQVNRSNVNHLRLSWSWALPNGPTEATPLVHDGVMFLYGFGDIVQALNAVTGDLLWHSQRRVPKGVQAGLPKAIAIFGDRLFMPTSDARIVALDVKTGRQLWESNPVGDAAFKMNGGPLIADGKVIIGTGGQQPGGNFLVAFDVEAGKESWRFATIAPPGKPEVDTWNNLPMEKRTGGAVWTPPSYDADLGLVFFGPAPTYDTAPLRERLKNTTATNDALYTDTTVALNPRTGKVVWFYQHLPNDQWDHDWGFERQIVALNVGGKPRKVVFTGGKPGIFDALDAATGKYLFSKDVGLQDIVVAIDPDTGTKTVDASKIPGDGLVKSVCPHAAGGRNWEPASYNPRTKIMVITMVESCMDLVRVEKGERGSLSSGVRWALRPRPDSDGRFGRIDAINLETRDTVWTERRRAPLSSGVLNTAGGLVFVADVARWFSAHDEGTGKKLWSVRLADVPNSNPITYAVNGKQYVAIVSGNGGFQTAIFQALVPEIKNPVNRSGTVWVFELEGGSTAAH